MAARAEKLRLFLYLIDREKTSLLLNIINSWHCIQMTVLRITRTYNKAKQEHVPTVKFIKTIGIMTQKVKNTNRLKTGENSC